MAEEAAVTEDFPAFSEVTNDPRWGALKPNEKLAVVDRWTNDLRQFSARHTDWDQDEIKKRIDTNYADLRLKVLDNHMAAWESNLNELGQSFAATGLAAAEALPRTLSTPGKTTADALAESDKRIAELSTALGVDKDGNLSVENPDEATQAGLMQLQQLKEQRDAVAKSGELNGVAEEGPINHHVQDQMRGLADWLAAARKALPERDNAKTNPALHNTMLAGVARGVGKLLAFSNPVGPAVLAGEAYTTAADAAIDKAQKEGVTDVDQLAEIADKAGKEAIVSSAPQLLAYTVGGSAAGKLVSKVLPAAGALVKGLATGAAAGATNLTVSGTMREIEAAKARKDIENDTILTPEQKAQAIAQLPGFVGNTEENVVDLGFALHPAVHAAQEVAHFNVLKAHVQETLGRVDSHPTFTPQQKQAAKDAILNRIQDPAKRSVVSAEYEAAKAAAPVDAATVPLGPDSPTAQVSQRIAAENKAAAVLAALQRDHETAKAEIAEAEAKAAEEVAKTETPAAEPEPAPVVEPAPVEPAPVEPAPVEPAPVEPAPVEPAPVAEPENKAPEPDTETQLKALGLTDDLIQTLSPAEAEQIIADSKTKPIEEAQPEPTAEPEPLVEPEPVAPETLPEVNESVDTKEPEPVPAAAAVDPERKAEVDTFFGDAENYEELTDLAARYISKRRILGVDPTDLVSALYQKALTKGKLDIKKGAWRVWDDEFGRKQAREQARRGASLDTETEAGTLGDVIGETTPAEIAANARAEEAPKPVDLDAYRDSLTPEDRDTFDRLSVKAQNGEHYRTKKEKAFMAKMERELRGPKAPVDESIPEPEPVEDGPASNDDRRHAIDRAYKLHTRDVLSGPEYKAFKERIEDAENLSELHQIHRELEAKTPAENLSWDLIEDREHHERTQRETVAQRRDYYRLGGTLNQALTRLMEVTTDKGLRALATVLRFATHQDSRIRVNASLRENRIAGRYHADEKLTEINPFISNRSVEETIAHEALHDATLNKIHDYFDNHGARLTPTERDAIRELEALRQEALGHAPKEVREAATRYGESEGDRLRAAIAQNPEAAPFYGLMSLREYVSELFTNQQFKDFLNSHKVLTTAPRAARLTYWDRTMQLLARLFGAKPGSILAESIRHSAGLFKERPLDVEGDRLLRRPSESPLRESPHKDLLDRATELRDMQARLRTLRKEAPGSTRDLHEIVREHQTDPTGSLAEKLETQGGLDKTNAAGVAGIVETKEPLSPGPGAASADEPLASYEERKFGARFTKDERIDPTIRDATGERYYEPVPNDITAEKARKLVDERGTEEATAIVRDERNSLPFHVRSAMGQTVILRLNQEYQSLKATDPARAGKILSDATDLAEWQMDYGTRLGRGVQSFAMWARLTPEGKLLTFKRAVKKARDTFTSKNGDAIAAVKDATNKVSAGAAAKVSKSARVKDAISRIDKSAPVWGRYKAEAVKALAKKLETQTPEQPPALQEFTQRVVKTLREKMKRLVDLPEGPARTSRDIADLREAATNFDKYKEVWTEAQDAIRKKYADKPAVLQELDTFLGQILDEPFAPAALDRTIKASLKELDISLPDLIRSHYLDQSSRLRGLAEHISAKTGLSGEHAALIERAVRIEMAQVTTQAKKAALMQMVKTKNPVARKVKSKLDRLIEHSNLGALTDKVFYDAVSDTLGLPDYSPAVEQKITDLANKVQEAPEGLVRDRAVLDLNSFMAKQKGFKSSDLPLGIYYAHMLSGYNTHLVNMIDTALNVVSEVGNLAVLNPRAASKVMAAALRGLGEGRADAMLALSEGRQVTDTKWLDAHRLEELASFGEKGGVPLKTDTKIGRAFKTAAESPALKFLNTYKYVGRALAAMDSVMYRSASEAHATLSAYRLAEQSGFKGNALDAKMHEILGSNSMKVFADQARREGLITPAEIRARAMELRDATRPADVVAAASEFAGEATYNHDPRGVLGDLSNTIEKFSTKHPSAKLFVPFTRIVANVTNRGLNYTPLVANRLRASSGYWGETGATPDQMAATRARMIAGTAGIAALGMLQATGAVTVNGAGPSDPDKKKQLQAAGWKPYSIKIGDTYINYTYTPLGLGLSILGNMSDAVRYNEMSQKNVVTRGVYATTRVFSTVFSQSFLSGLSKLFDLLSNDPTRSVQGVKDFFAGTVGTATYPALARDVYRIFDPTVYQSNDLLEDMLQRTPFAAAGLKPAINAFGEPISAPRQRFVTTLTSDPVWREVVARNLRIPVPSKTTPKDPSAEVKEPLDPDQYYRYTQESGKHLKQAMAAALPDLTAMTDEEAQEWINETAKAIHEEVLGGIRQ